MKNYMNKCWLKLEDEWWDNYHGLILMHNGKEIKISKDDLDIISIAKEHSKTMEGLAKK